MIAPKDSNNLSVTNSKEMDICDLPNKEFKKVVKGKLNYKKTQEDNSTK